MKLQNTILSYLEAAGKQNDDILEFHQQDAMTLAMNLTNELIKLVEEISRLEPGKDDYEHEYLLGWNAALAKLKEREI